VVDKIDETATLLNCDMLSCTYSKDAIASIDWYDPAAGGVG
jgi:hypothetical protein